MANITLQGNPINTIGDLPVIREDAPSTGLTKIDLSDIKISDYKGKSLVLNFFHRSTQRHVPLQHENLTPKRLL